MVFLRQSKPQLVTIRTLQHRTFIDTPIKHVRDKGLDHALTHFNHLRPVLNLKNLILSQPSKTLPLSTLNPLRQPLNIPFRPLDFARLYPTVFTTAPPPNSFEPHIALTPQAIDLHNDETTLLNSAAYKQNIANRLVKLTMIAKVNKFPVSLIEKLKWDLGLPDNYVDTIIPEFPDYFTVRNGNLELVCWVNELAKAANQTGDFKMSFSNGFEMDRKYEKWLELWKKLPYLSPYEFNGVRLAARSDESDKWVVGVLHEVLSCFVTRRTERENLLRVGEWLGIRARVKRALIHHPGIFYTSSRMNTYTVVLKEGFKRGVLVDDDELMRVRNRYVHLMHKCKDEPKRVREENKMVEEENKMVEDDDVSESEGEDETEEEQEEEEKDTRGRNGTAKPSFHGMGVLKSSVRNRNQNRNRSGGKPRTMRDFG